MKETINKLSEKQIALLTLALTIVALIIGIALPEIRTMLGLERSHTSATYEQSAVSTAPASTEVQALPAPPAPPGAAQGLPRTEIKKDFSNSGALTGEFVVFSGVTFKNSGFLKGKVIIQKDATFVNSGAIEGTVVNQGGTFTNSGYLDGPLKVE